MPPSKSLAPAARPERIDSGFMQALVGYHTRRASLRILDLFGQRMARLELTTVEFSILCLIGHNPGLTPTQLCAELELLQPNLTKLLARLDRRHLLQRQALAGDKRVVCLSLSPAGQRLLDEAQDCVATLEAEFASALTDRQRETLIRLLRRLYEPGTRAPATEAP